MIRTGQGTRIADHGDREKVMGTQQPEPQAPPKETAETQSKKTSEK